jgi:hypothetical protein
MRLDAVSAALRLKGKEGIMADVKGWIDSHLPQT